MKKTIINLAIAAIAFATPIAMMAQSDKNNVQSTEANKQPRKTADKPKYNPFEGLNLSEAQQTKLAELKKSDKAQRGTKKNATCNQATCNQNCDSAKQSNQKQRIADRRTMRSEYLGQVKQILTPEQYTKFLENNYVNASSRKCQPNGKLNTKGNRRGDLNKKHANGGKTRGQKPATTTAS